MFDETISIDSPTGARLNACRRDARGHERGVILILHGLAEHAGRYGRVAADLADAGFHVYAHDHRGHGSTSAPDAPLRRFAKNNGAAKLLTDARTVMERAMREHPHLPVVVLGHSLGGHIALAFALARPRPLAGLAIWNAAFGFGTKERLGRTALKIERALKGSDVASEVFRRATFDAFARAIDRRRTMADWLSHDEAAVDRYLDDPLCGWTPTVSMAFDILMLLEEVSDEATWSRLPPSLPIHVLGGSEDPATNGGEACHRLAGGLRHAGCRDVTAHVVKGARHEILNEIEPLRANGLASLGAWLDRIAARA